MPDVRYLNLGAVDPDTFTAIWSYDDVVTQDGGTPLLMRFFTDRTVIAFWCGELVTESCFGIMESASNRGSRDWNREEYVDLRGYIDDGRLSGKLTMTRIYDKTMSQYDADMLYWVATPRVSHFIFFYPGKYFFF